VTAAAATQPAPARPRELDDVTLVRAQRGEAAAFATLVATYQDAVFALLWRFLGRRANAALVEDLAQVTFLGVHRGIARFHRDGAARLSTWILTIAARAALKERRGSAPATIAVEEIAEALPARDASDTQLRRRELADALARAIEQLDAGHRAVFLLREYHEFDYKEIAAALELDLGTVKSRLSRARSQLREQLKEFAP
jgi:RNA polymerase sigma-70 factor (ECF subfamily)